MVPVAKARARMGKYGAYTPKKTKVAETRLKSAMKVWAKEKKIFPLVNACSIHVVFSIPRPKSRKNDEYPIYRPDADNYLKLVMDAGNSILWKDDSIVVNIVVEKKYATTKEEAGVSVLITPLIF